jgi:hypothetical protein
MITENGSDHGLFLNGKSIITADPSGGDDTAQVQEMGESLAIALGTELKRVEFPCKSDSWNWGDVAAELVGLDVMVPEGGMITLMDTIVNEEDSPIDYRIKIEGNQYTGQVFFTMYEKTIDKLGKDAYENGLNGILEVRNGCPALSLGISPDQNIMHVISNACDQLAIVSETESPEWASLSFTGSSKEALVYKIDDGGLFSEMRVDIANEVFGSFDIEAACGEDLMVGDSSHWEIEDGRFVKGLHLVDNGGRETTGYFLISFAKDSTHIASVEAGLGLLP